MIFGMISPRIVPGGTTGYRLSLAMISGVHIEEAKRYPRFENALEKVMSGFNPDTIC